MHTAPTTVRLTQAVRFKNNSKEIRDVPASNHFDLSGQAYGASGIPIDMLFRAAPMGGTFTDLLVPYLEKQNSLYKDYKNARAALPPPLLREGERTQPEWLFQFLRDPTKIRPMTVLRMPKFNMSDDDAQMLVNYFAATDRLQNPGGGLDHPYEHIPQRSESFWRDVTARYVESLRKDNLFEDRKKAVAGIAGFNLEQWETDGVFAHDAFRLLTNYNNACMGCHNVGPLKAKNPEREQGPPLDISWQRVRPEWTARWIANPERLISYPTPMPTNFARTDKYPEFHGSQIETIFAVRDVLLGFPKVAEMPVNRVLLQASPPPAGDKK
jgi:hypothetical protein